MKTNGSTLHSALCTLHSVCTFLLAALSLLPSSAAYSQQWDVERPLDRITVALGDTVEREFVLRNNTFQPLNMYFELFELPVEMDVYRVEVPAYSEVRVPVYCVASEIMPSYYRPFYGVSVTSPTGHIAPGADGNLIVIDVPANKVQGAAVMFHQTVYFAGIDGRGVRVGLRDVGTVPVNIVQAWLSDSTNFEMDEADWILGPVSDRPTGGDGPKIKTRMAPAVPMQTMLHVLGISNNGDTVRAQTLIVAGADPNYCRMTPSVDTVRFNIDQIETTVTVRNTGVAGMSVDSLIIEGDDANMFALHSKPHGKMEFPSAQAMRLRLICSAQQHTKYATAELVLYGKGFDGLPRITRIPLVYGSRQQKQKVNIDMHTTDAKAGETCTVTLATASASASALLPNTSYCIFGLRYDASILEPLEPTLDNPDQVVGGYRTSRFRVEVTSSTLPGTIVSRQFRVLSGSAGQTSVSVSEFSWYNSADEKLDVETVVNGGTVSVLEDSEATLWPLGTATVRVYGVTGTLVLDATGLTEYSLPPGCYFAVRTANNKTTVTPIVVN